MYLSTLDTPIGLLHIRANDSEVYFIGFPEESAEETGNDISKQAKIEFQEYFSGKRHGFDFPMRQEGTIFRQSVWDELLRIKPGSPITYAALAKRMNNPLAILAIASANGKNNLMIAVPCHRVIGSNGELVGFAGGLWRKKWLLAHETEMMGMGQASLLIS